MSLYIDNKYVRLISSRLRNFKQKKDNLYQMSCPICGDSKKNLLKARGYVYQRGNNLLYSCHNCGVSIGIANLLKNVDPLLYQEYILENYKTGESNTKPFSITTIEPPKFGKVQRKKYFDYSERCDNLSEQHFCIQYLKNRQIPKKYYSELFFTPTYKKFVDDLIPNHGKTILDDARLVIPFYDNNDELIAVSGRALENSDRKLRYITIRIDDKNENKLLYGLNRVNLKETIYVVEGPLDSLFLNNCVASGDGNLGIAAQRLINLGVKKENIVLVSDNECRNKEIVKLIGKNINSGFNVVIWPDNIEGKDINEMILNGSDSNSIYKIVQENTMNGVRANLKYNFWKKV